MCACLGRQIHVRFSSSVTFIYQTDLSSLEPDSSYQSCPSSFLWCSLWCTSAYGGSWFLLLPRPQQSRALGSDWLCVQLAAFPAVQDVCPYSAVGVSVSVCPSTPFQGGAGIFSHCCRNQLLVCWFGIADGLNKRCKATHKQNCAGASEIEGHWSSQESSITSSLESAELGWMFLNLPKTQSIV